MTVEPRWPAPRGWDWTSIEAIADVTGGGTPSANDPSNFSHEGGIPWVTPADLTGYEDTYIARGRRNLTDRGYKSSSAKLLPAGAVLFTSRAPIGYCAIAANQIATNQGFKSLTLFGSISGEFTRYYLKWSKPFLESLASGTTFLELSGSKLQQAPFPLPPIAEQKRIVAKLDALNAKSVRARTELARIETLVSRYKQAVLDLLCDVSHSTASLRELVDQKRGIPYGIVQTGKPVVDGVPTVRCGDIKNYSIRKNELKLVDRQIARQYGRTELVGGEVLIAIRGSIGETCVADNDLVGCNISREVAMIPLLPGTSAQFVMYFLKSNKAKEFIGANTKGSAQQGINLGDLRNLPIPALGLEEQHEIVCRIESAFAKIDRLAKEAKRALELVGRLDEAILAKAFRGELVPQDENDEPAEKLLERIRAERQAAPKVKKRIAKRTSAMSTARDFLNAKLPNWPHDGISFQELRSEFSGGYDNLKDAVFAMLTDENAPLRQVYDEQRSTMTLRKREQ